MKQISTLNAATSIQCKRTNECCSNPFEYEEIVVSAKVLVLRYNNHVVHENWAGRLHLLASHTSFSLRNCKIKCNKLCMCVRVCECASVRAQRYGKLFAALIELICNDIFCTALYVYELVVLVVEKTNSAWCKISWAVPLHSIQWKVSDFSLAFRFMSTHNRHPA